MTQSSSSTNHRLVWQILWGIPHLIFYTIGASAFGALLGSLIFPLVGTLLRMNLTTSQMILNGARDGGFYFFMWGFGAALIYTVMQIRDRMYGTQSIPWRKS